MTNADCPRSSGPGTNASSEYCDSSHNCYRCSYITPHSCDALGGSCCTADFIHQCGDVHDCDAAPDFMRRIAQVTSFISSVTVKLTKLQQPNSTGSGSWGGFEDGGMIGGNGEVGVGPASGLLFGFLHQLEELINDQSNPIEWAALGEPQHTASSSLSGVHLTRKGLGVHSDPCTVGNMVTWPV